jgi:hypothetical protein
LQSQQSGRGLVCLDDSLFIAGCMLYWAEGDKSRNSVRMANSDPEVLRLSSRAYGNTAESTTAELR